MKRSEQTIGQAGPTGRIGGTQMKELTYATFASELRASVPGFADVYDAHVRDNDEVLPHPLLGDLVRFLCRKVEEDGLESSSVDAAMNLLEKAITSGDPKLEELVVVSFLEAFDEKDWQFRALTTLFGPELNKWYEYVIQWRPGQIDGP